MISYDGNVKVVDFGVARFDTGGHATRTGEVKGKMAYMSPEQALGEELDRRSDLFSVGAMLFECLTGRRMWGEGTDLELMRKIALEPPPHLDAALPGAHPVLVQLQTRLTARDPGARPPTARDVATQLRAFAMSAGGPNSRRVVPATMTALFADEARRRRERLASALQEASPSCVVALRQDLDLPSGAHPASDPPPRKARWGVPALLALLALGLVAAALMTRSNPSVVSSHAVESASPASQTPPSQAVLVVTTAAAVTAIPTLDVSVSKPPPAKPPKPPVRPPFAKPASPNKLPDVDPSPF
jgi:serine/threonine protein kinase